MNKQYLFIIMAIVCSLFLVGAVSAHDADVLADSNDQVKNPIDVEVNYEYNENINPHFVITQGDNTIDYQKTSKSTNSYSINLNNATDGQYTLSVYSPGYETVSQNISVGSNQLNNLVFNLKPTGNYKIGYEITSDANKRLNFASADDVLVITTAGLTRINDTTTENVLDGIINAADGYVTYGQGNILTLSAIRSDPTNFGFVTRKGDSLTMAFYKNCNINPVYVGTINSANMNDKKWKELQNLLGKEDAYSYVSLANAWAAGLPSDILTQAAYHGHVCTGLVSGQAMIHTLIKYFPPRGETGVAPLENTAYYVVAVPGGSDDDAFTWSMDITPGKRAYIGIDTMVNKTMTGFIRWDESANTGILILMTYNEDGLKNEFKKLTKLNPDASAANDLKYQKWLIDKLSSDPESLVTIVAQYGNLTNDQLVQLIGTSDASIDIDARGLDLDYINSLNLPTIGPDSTKDLSKDTISNQALKSIGIEAANIAIDHFKELNITIEKDMQNFYVLTSAGFVRINNTDTSMVYDGIAEVLGSRLSRATLLPVHTGLWKELVFDFFWLDPTNNTNTASFSLLYNQTTGKFEVCPQNYNIQDNSIKYNPAYDTLLAWLFHNHVCPGGSPGILLADKVFDELPLGENESYMLVTTLAYCKEDTLSRLLGVSPGMQNYYNLRVSEITADAGNKASYSNIIVRWNSETKTGDATLVTIAFPKFATGGSANYEEWNKLFKGDYSSPGLVRPPLIELSVTKEINEDMLNTIIAGAYDTEAGDAVQYFFGLDEKLPEAPANGNTDNNNGGNTKVDNGGSKKSGSSAKNSGSSSKTSNSNNRGSSNNGASSNIVSRSSTGYSSSVGQSSDPLTVSAASEATPVSDNPQNTASPNKNAKSSPSESKAYEVQKSVPKTDSNNLIYGLAFILVIGAIVGLVYIKRK